MCVRKENGQDEKLEREMNRNQLLYDDAQSVLDCTVTRLNHRSMQTGDLNK